MPVTNRLGVPPKASFILLILVIANHVCSGQTANPQLQALYDTHNWPALRKATDQSNAPLFYRAAVEAAYNDVKPAVEHLDTVIRETPHTEKAYESHEMLTNLYFRNGMYHEGLAELTTMLAEKPTADDVKATIPLLRALSQSPDQNVVSRKASIFTMRMEQGNMFVPVTVNNSQAEYILDTGANFSLMSEGEAKRLGLVVISGDSKVGDSSGTGIGMQTTTAKDVIVGGLHLKNVAFGVIPDSQEPFVGLPESHRALLGIPVLLAMQAIRWTPTGSFALVRPHRSRRFNKANVSFVGMFPTTQVAYQGKLLDFSIDTGAIRTDLEPQFAELFPRLLATEGNKESHKLTGVGGSTLHAAVRLPSVRVQVGGLDVTLKPAHVLLQASSASSSWAAGNLGMDLLNQAHSVSLDFKAMTLSLN